MEGVYVFLYTDGLRIATPEDIRQWELVTANQVSSQVSQEPPVRLFVDLFPYNPAAMSPNPETTAEELPFVSGQILKVFGDEDDDGFYHGESGGLSGAVPSNMVSVIPVDDDYLKHQLIQQGFLPVDHTCTGISFSHYLLHSLSHSLKSFTLKNNLRFLNDDK
ncbi:RIMS-binding protein 2-like [Salvelinus fontinalis]|uniref:RIMS-binding protein 2-like n=1 Tax=Salvelinus fontinalis TaxID=8038 RepID=UPI0024857159|nr:RIMS-binding protein 2-like [Salvelinus fontinalis]